MPDSSVSGEGPRRGATASPAPVESPDFVSAWPLGLNDTWFADRTPQLESGFAREQGRMMLYGAQHLADGDYTLLIP